MPCGTRTNVFTCRRDVSACRKYSASSSENFKRFTILVRVFISYACRADVVEMLNILVQTSCICCHFSSLLAVINPALPGTSLSTSFGEKVTTSSHIRTMSARHAREMLRVTTTNSNICTTLYEFCSTRSEFSRVVLLYPKPDLQFAVLFP